MSIKLKEVLKEKGLSVTKARLEICQVLTTNHGPFSVSDLLTRLPEGLCDQATLYRNLNTLLDAKLINSLNLGEDFNRFEWNHEGHHHHHVRCRECGDIKSLHRCIIQEIEKDVRDMGYKEVTHNLEFIGTCVKCQTTAK